VIAAFILASMAEAADPLAVSQAVDQRCASNPGEIVVCGSTEPDRTYRMPKLSPQYEAPPICI
jgi:hypothetical protein